MIDSLLGVDLPLPVKLVVAFVVVLLLIGAATWIFRRLGGGARLGTTGSRGRQPRLAVIDAAAVDGRRRLVLVRRDNVEHLIMIGGPTDVVVEQNIVRAVPVNQPRDGSGPRAETGRGAPEPAPRAAAEPQRAPATVSELPTRPPRTEPPVRPARPEAPPRRVEPLPPRAEAPRRPAPPPISREPVAREPAAREPVEVHPAPPMADPNLVDMAQKLEAALRPPTARRTEAVEPAPAEAAPPVAPEPTNGRVAPPVAAQRPSVPPPAPASEPKPAGKSVFDSLEEEMASLLGKPPSKP